MDKSPKVFVSKAGSDFLIAIANVPTLAKHERNLRQLLLGYKKRDWIDVSKRSIFYSIIFNLIVKIKKIEQYQALDLLSTTSADLLAKD